MHISTKCSIAVHCLIFIYEYGSTANVTSSLLAKSSGCNAVIIRNILSALKKGGIIELRPGVGNATLTKDPHDISLHTIFTLLEPNSCQNLIGLHPSPAETCPVGRNIHQVLSLSYAQVREDLTRSLQGIRLDTIIDQYHGILAQEK